jgi:signal transduction histidine kinase
MPWAEGSVSAGTALGSRSAALASQDAAIRRLLARLIEEAKPEILEVWFELLVEQGLSYQRQAARENPQGIAASFHRILDTIRAWLLSADEAAELRTREAMQALYREFGRQWAEREPAPQDGALEPPRLIQAIWRVHLQRNANRPSLDEFYQCAITLHQLAMDLAMARIRGYLDYKEEQLAAQRETVSQLLDELTHVEARQRHAIALDLHDNLAQRLASLFNGIQHCEHVIDRDAPAAKAELRQLRQVANDALRDARTTIRDLHFGVVSQDRGLAALPDYLADLDADTGISHEARIGATLPALPPTQQSLILRVVQEALTNAHKHAHASRVVVAVDAAAGKLVAEVTDDGCGFDPDEALARAQRRGRMGMIGMQERTELLKGTLSIESTPGSGTTVRLTVPLPTAAA